MAEDLKISGTTREEKYISLMPQVKGLLEGEPDQIACMANFCASVKETFDFLWVGFYIVKGKELVLGPFQGPVACTRIAFGRGVCGKAWELKTPLLVDDVDTFPGHIACSSASRSELVIPLLHNGIVWAILDLDDRKTGSFSPTDQHFLTQMLELVHPSH